MTTNNLTASELRGAVWRKSSYSGGSEGQCVEVADLTATPFAGQRGIRDSKTPEGPALLIPKGSFANFMTAVKAGEFDI
ncbi:DUF397 domain-containing protein (plasmid) [Streptomyces sp. NBC_01732]|uniref:DUF397 domain-containing protein n=1 Tax=Streptomyces sp. NBC_01732 TaxID=2975926 RepID=UPI00352D3044|nr:DUF397 domain-containing protein [Streptomyces sp. NBC_01732]